MHVPLAAITPLRLGAALADGVATALLALLAFGMLGLTWRVLRARRGLPDPPRITWPATGAAFIVGFVSPLVAPREWQHIVPWIHLPLLFASILLLPTALVARFAPLWFLNVEPTRALTSKRGLLALGALLIVAGAGIAVLIAHRVSVQKSLDREIAAAAAQVEPHRQVLERNAMLRSKATYLNALIGYVVAVRGGGSAALPTFVAPEPQAVVPSIPPPTWRAFEQGPAIALRRSALDDLNAACAQGANLQRHAADIEREIDNIDAQLAEMEILLRDHLPAPTPVP